MSTTQSLLQLLVDALLQPSNRQELVNRFQQEIWNKPHSIVENWIWDVFQNLAYDLDYYEPDISMRTEDPSYYGNDQFEKEIKAAFQKLEKGGYQFQVKDGRTLKRKVS